MPKPIINYNKINNLKELEQVIDVCPANVFEKKGEKVIVARPNDCIGCRACESLFDNDEIEVKD